MAYFDNAATSYPKPVCVYEYMDHFYRNCIGSAGRGSYSSVTSINSLVSKTRDAIKDLLHCPSKEVVFEPSDTTALNIVIQGLIKKGIKNVYITPFEHNAVTRTLHAYEITNAIFVYVLDVSQNFTFNLEKIRYQFENIAPDLVIISHASNVIGLVPPVEDIFYLAKQFKAITVLDMAQTAGVVDCEVGLETIDFATFAGHKSLLGPTGIGGFVMNPHIDIEPVLFGGTGVDSAEQNMPESLPSRFEVGTTNVLGIAGLNASLNWIAKTGVSVLYEKEVDIRSKLIELFSHYDFVTIVGNNPNLKYVGIVSILINGISSDSAGDLFNRLGIAVRAGLHCAPRAHQFLGTYPAGTVRFSVNSFTSADDFLTLKEALDYIKSNI